MNVCKGCVFITVSSPREKTTGIANFHQSCDDLDKETALLDSYTLPLPAQARLE